VQKPGICLGPQLPPDGVQHDGISSDLRLSRRFLPQDKFQAAVCHSRVGAGLFIASREHRPKVKLKSEEVYKKNLAFRNGLIYKAKFK
jgi:hypothetical protein